MNLSFRARVLLLVFLVGALPLGVLGIWLTGTVARSGEALLGSRLESALEGEARAIELNWIRYRSALLDLADRPEVRARLGGDGGDRPPAAVTEAFATLVPRVEGLTLRDTDGAPLWQLGRAEPDAGAFLAFGALLTVTVPLAEPLDGTPLGRLDALIPVNGLRSSSAAAAALGAIITAEDPVDGRLLLPAPFDPSLLDRDRFTWNDAEWITRRRPVTEPAITLAAAAPVAPFAAPFHRAARRGALALALAAVLALMVAMWLTARMTRSLELLAGAAGEVAAGGLGRQVAVHGNDEVARVVRAFNTMSESLRRTVDQLAERESLSAVNEFAGSLAHEVRNPLTAVRLNLQVMEEALPADSPLREPLDETLEDIRRLDRTVAGALDTARAGRLTLTVTDLRQPMAAAARAADAAFAEATAQLRWTPPTAPVLARADADALERVVLNLLLNAAAALPPGRLATLELLVVGRQAVLRLRDEGPGLPAETASRVFEPFFTTRPGGTGLGLAVVRRIVTAHRGEITFHSVPGEGTTVEVRLALIEATATT